jgi:NAD(P)-dependent dehydrogenase (short-subunit alcohol dehydrogenase family)
MLFNGETAIITGGAQGIGKAIAEEFAREGAFPVIFDISEKKGSAAAEEIRASGHDAMFVRCDVSSAKDITRAVAETGEKRNTIDILVNNAGILHSTPVEEITEEEWDRMMAVNLKSVFFMVQQVLPYMKAQHKGRVVNISSLAGRMGGFANGLGYTATKAGIIGLTYGFARRLAPFGVTVNAIAPGTTETDILKAFTPERIRELSDSVPIKRLGKPQDIANAAVFMASDKASFMTGAVVDINGGMFMG